MHILMSYFFLRFRWYNSIKYKGGQTVFEVYELTNKIISIYKYLYDINIYLYVLYEN